MVLSPGSHLLIFFHLLHCKPSKVTRNPFYFTLKIIFVLEILKFLCWLFGHVEEGLIRKPRLISKFMTSHNGQSITAMYIKSNLSRSEGSQTMQFGRLTEYNLRNIFLEKSYTMITSLDQQSETFQSLFLVNAPVKF